MHLNVKVGNDRDGLLMMKGLKMKAYDEAINHRAAAVGKGIKASKTKAMSTVIRNEQRKAILLDGECVEDVDKFKYLGSNTIRAPKKIRSRINLTRCAFSRLQP